MYQIEMHGMSDSFLECWRAAGMHLNSQQSGGIDAWLRAHPYPPFLEHLSFRLGNQLFFVRVEDVAGEVTGPGSLQGLALVAESCGGHSCALPMVKQGQKWIPAKPGWGLVNARTQELVDPPSLVTDEMIEMADWEVHDMAVQIVRSELEKQGRKLMSSQGNPDIDPAIWFVGESNGPEWVVVRGVRYPERKAERPEKWPLIAKQCSRMSDVGWFASVAIASAKQPFESSDEKVVPLWRGHAMHVNYGGLE